MHTSLMKNIVLSSFNKEGQAVQIKVVNGPLIGKEFQAKKVQENISGEIVNCYHFTDGEGVKTYLQEKDVTIL